ncbi:hypothetical protein [Methanothermococcus okinawensis]|uniref:Uncharacterized protein n=1 Tax=Methanothermococcus okinawensis (strain DSM 14208 / JCM 11175 / IH1) TaxID=647113 RepID=F8AKT1_METOI|nr:hypothetical protein [Methanothermococcus okinawensis]AEH06425.1 hypothetical protein Metok_0441 [Methanothermococcus okinawensis IH1]
MNPNENEQENKIRLKNKSVGAIVGFFIWLILYIIIGFSVSSISNHAFNYLLYVISVISCSTFVLIGIYLFNKENPIVKELLKIDIGFLLVGIICAVIEITLHQSYNYDRNLPLIIYVVRLITIYMTIDKIIEMK